MFGKNSKFLAFVCLVFVLETGNALAFSNDEKKSPPHPEAVNLVKTDERMITEIQIEIMESDECYCGGDRFPWVDPPLVRLKRTLLKPFKFVGKLFKSRD